MIHGSARSIGRFEGFFYFKKTRVPEYNQEKKYGANIARRRSLSFFLFAKQLRKKVSLFKRA